MPPLPSRAQLISVVDDDFYIRHNDAPRPLDPHDPAQAALVREWNETFRTTLHGWVDSIFFTYFPYAPRRLDPDNPGHATMIEYWQDIRNAIRDGTPPRWNWSAWTEEPGETADAAQPAAQPDA